MNLQRSPYIIILHEMRDLIRVLSLGFALYGMECTAQTVSGQIAGHDYVDLGLPSGTLWATCNVGSYKPTDEGDRYAWGETKPKVIGECDDYKWYIGELDYTVQFSKYVLPKIDGLSFGTVDNKAELDAEDDAARAKWGSSWRMPTKEDIEELINGCTWELKSYSRIGTSKKNGNTIVFGTTRSYDGLFWSSSLNKISSSAYFLLMNKKVVELNTTPRWKANNIRAVVSNSSSHTKTIGNQSLQVYAENETIYIANAQANAKIQVLDMNGIAIAASETDGYGNAELSAAKGVYVVTVGNMSTKVILK